MDVRHLSNLELLETWNKLVCQCIESVPCRRNIDCVKCDCVMLLQMHNMFCQCREYKRSQKNSCSMCQGFRLTRKDTKTFHHHIDRYRRLKKNEKKRVKNKLEEDKENDKTTIVETVDIL